MELYQAHEQWAKRPADERFNSLESLHGACLASRNGAVEKSVPFGTLRFEAQGNDVAAVSRRGGVAPLAHWAFGQVAARAGAPAGYLRTLPATLAAQNLNYGVKALQDGKDANMLFRVVAKPASPELAPIVLVNAVTGDRYMRIWNHEVTERLLDLQSRGWAPAKPTFRSFGDDRPALYASDHDMFAMVMMPNTTLQQPVASAKHEAPLYRGLIYSNSEVGAACLSATSFWFNAMCGNHIIWGATNVVELKARHVGTIRERMAGWELAIRKYADSSATEDAAKMQHAATVRIAATKEQVLDLLFGKYGNKIGMSKTAIEGAYNAVIEDEDGDARTPWGFVQGATRYSQTLQYADERIAVDRAAAKVLDLF